VCQDRLLHEDRRWRGIKRRKESENQTKQSSKREQTGTEGSRKRRECDLLYVLCCAVLRTDVTETERPRAAFAC